MGPVQTKLRRMAHTLPPPPPPGLRSRSEMIGSMKARGQQEPYDVLVIGGGATGAGCALDAATRGLKVACVERGDFGSETSSRSTKLIWAGSRYLFNVVAALTSSKMLTAPIETVKKCYEEFHMVLGCARERRYMAEKNAHLVNWIPIALPFDKWFIWPPPMGAWAFSLLPIACRLDVSHLQLTGGLHLPGGLHDVQGDDGGQVPTAHRSADQVLRGAP